MPDKTTPTSEERAEHQGEAGEEIHKREPGRIRTVRFKFEQIIYYVLGIIEALLAFRFVFRLFGANPGSPFVTLIYKFSDVFLRPFSGIFPPFQESGAVFEWSVLVAMAVYAILAYGLARLTIILTS